MARPKDLAFCLIHSGDSRDYRKELMEITRGKSAISLCLAICLTLNGASCAVVLSQLVLEGLNTHSHILMLLPFSFSVRPNEGSLHPSFLTSTCP
jgi:hypothetical protein